MVLFPGVMLPLHIFEERYRRLVRDLLDLAAGARHFGVVAIKAGTEVGADGISALHDIGCTAELQYAEAYPDGRYDIIGTGSRRFRIIRVLPAEPSGPVQAEVEFLPDEQTADSAGIASRVSRQFVAYREALLTAQGLAPESDDQPAEMPADPGELAYLVAAAMVLDLSDKQSLLAAPTVDHRLKLELTLLRREASMVGGLSMRPAVELPRAPYASN
jgi:Lon protease-like protein